MYKNMIDVLTEGKEGVFKLDKFEIKQYDIFNRIPKGSYIRLIDKNDCIMSDTPMEKRTNSKFVENANGDVFIAGLGIGLIILAIQDKEEVRSITVLEKEEDIIKLVGSQLPLNKKVKIIKGDVFNYKFPKDTKFDSIYFDIWNNINSDIYENEMKLLKSRYRKYKVLNADNSNSFISCWAEKEAKNNKYLY